MAVAPALALAEAEAEAEAKRKAPTRNHADERETNGRGRARLVDDASQGRPKDCAKGCMPVRACAGFGPSSGIELDEEDEATDD